LKDLRAVRAFRDEFKQNKAMVVCNENYERIVDNIRIIDIKFGPAT